MIESMSGDLIASAREISVNVYALIKFVIEDVIQFIGIVVFLGGLLALLRNRNASMRAEGITGDDIKSSVVAMIAGSIIFALPDFVEVFNNSAGLNGASAREALFGGSQIDTSSITGAMTSVVKLIMVLTGILAMIKGSLLLNDWGKGKDVPMSAVLSFIIGGALLINFFEVVHIIANSMGSVGLASIVSSLLA